MSNIIRSPFFYVGDKYKLMPQLKRLMPQQIDKFIEPFVGGGSSFLNINSKSYIVNDINPYVIDLHRFLSNYKNNPTQLLQELYESIDHYGLSCSYKGIVVPDKLKKQFIKTYYAKFNKNAYLAMRDDFNENQNNLHLLYLLLIYGFNHMIRFNGSGKFNLPVGNVDFNKNVHTALVNYLQFIKSHDITFYNMDYQDFLNQLTFTLKSYIFLDPPYLISMSEYNKLWNKEKEKSLCEYLDKLHKQGIHFGITNLIYHKNNFNQIFFEWSKQYFCYDIQSNYISFNDNTIKENSKEIFVTNYQVS